ncbi:aminotransferase class V-fold PLP-dependent enzyme [Thalassoroseus pseudoceratinae]|uniref:aminotransferase class V-fold PLP-dependent enzyme n=1 Tax=Thalassoroseus pseudoceratinae TaxID=2713176 RepID=UPI001423546D|nr:aminotransferase class V-fold PLP-dependent enzyme [Thalassoroseus pseudoceratinae]
MSDTIYLNHAGTSWPKPTPVLEAAERASHRDPLEWAEVFQLSHEKIASYFHVEPSRLLVTPSCTAALSVAVRDHDWKSGDRVLTSQYEHHALHRGLAKLGEMGVEVVQVPASETELVDLKILETQLQSGQVRLVAMTAACNVTGQLLPMDEIIELAHQYGALVLLDGAQVAGWFDLDLLAMKVDLFTFAGHKGPQAPWGIGGLYVSANVEMNSPLAACDLQETQQRAACAPMPGYCDTGSVNLSALAGMGAAVDWLREPKQADRLDRARRLTQDFTDNLREISNVKIHGDVPMEMKVSTVAITSDILSPATIATKLKEMGIVASAGFQCAPQAHLNLGTASNGVVRFSFGPQTQEWEMKKTVDSLKTILDQNR